MSLKAKQSTARRTSLAPIIENAVFSHGRNGELFNNERVAMTRNFFQKAMSEEDEELRRGSIGSDQDESVMDALSRSFKVLGQDIHHTRSLTVSSKSSNKSSTDLWGEEMEKSSGSTGARKRWEKFKNVTTLLKQPSKTTQLTSFISRQLHKYLLTVDEQIEEPTGTTKHGAVLFADASGFTKMTQQLSRHENGAEELSKIINAFFSPLLTIVDTFGGDVVKFSGDALTIVWFVDQEESERTHGYTCPNIAIATARACACSAKLHERLDNFLAIHETEDEPAVLLRLHMGIGCGLLTTVHVGGVFKRWEYILSGPPMVQIGNAEPLAKPGETVISPEAFQFVKKLLLRYTTVAELLDMKLRDEKEVGENGDYVRIDDLKRITIPRKYLQKLPVSQNVSALIRRYIPGAVLKCLDDNQPPQNEMRKASVIFTQIHGLKLEPSCQFNSSYEGNEDDLKDIVSNAQALMLEIQRNIYNWEGSINKLMVDDKGLLVLSATGLPPVPHFDDPYRAVSAALDLVKNLELLGDQLGQRVYPTIGVTTGRVFCGVVGSLVRREYTLMGDIVNLAARLMCQLNEPGVLVDEETYRQCRDSAPDRFSFVPLLPLSLKGMDKPVQAYQVKERKRPASVRKKLVLEISGREAERDRLSQMMDLLEDRFGGTVVLTGSRGSGKSQLVKSVSKEATNRKMSVLLVAKKGDTRKNTIVERFFNNNTTKYHVRTDELPVSILSSWQSVVVTILKHNMEEVSPHKQITRVLDILKEKNLHVFACLLRHVVPQELVQPILHFTPQTNTSLSFQQTSELLMNIVYELVIAHAKETSTLLMLHLQTGSALKAQVEPESWMLANMLSQHSCERREDSQCRTTFMIFVVTRPLGKITDPILESIWKNAMKDSCFLQLQPMGEMGQLRYAADVLTALTGVNVNPSAIPPDLAVYLDERAAGTPKHIYETIHECLSSNATPSGPAIVVAGNGRIAVANLADVKVPEKIRNIYAQEFDQLSTSHQTILKSVNVHKSFTPMMAREMIFANRNTFSSIEYNGRLDEDLKELAKVSVLKEVAVGPYVISNFPSDLYHPNVKCYAFKCKAMQEHVEKLLLGTQHTFLKKKAISRVAMVISAVLRLQRMFRRLQHAKISKESRARQNQAASVLQRAFRAFIRKKYAHTGRASAISSDYLRSGGGFTNWMHVVDTMQHRNRSIDGEDLRPRSQFHPQKEFLSYTINNQLQEVERTVVKRNTGRKLPPPPKVVKVFYKNSYVPVQPMPQPMASSMRSSSSSSSRSYLQHVPKVTISSASSVSSTTEAFNELSLH
eukprot:m.86392 g.86392  ORF g.86392 m.86392 type:complete len:1302 (-) comp8758_c0_seq1:118-4023(-)